jgi:hypothetical protein
MTFPLQATATGLPLYLCVREGMLNTLLASRGMTSEVDRKVYGSYYTRKALRTYVDNAKPSEHGYKHTAAHTRAEAKAMSIRAAQYLPGLNHIQIERAAIRSEKDEWIAHGNETLFKFERLDKVVGYDQGQETRWIRVEISSGYFHGHPISLSRVRKYVKDAQP